MYPYYSTNYMHSRMSFAHVVLTLPTDTYYPLTVTASAGSSSSKGVEMKSNNMDKFGYTSKHGVNSKQRRVNKLEKQVRCVMTTQNQAHDVCRDE